MAVLGRLVILLASLDIVISDSCDITERKTACHNSNNDILARVETLEKKVEGLKHINDRIEKLSKLT